MRWKFNPIPDDQIEALSRQAGCSPVVAGLLLRLGIDDPKRARDFLHPRLAHLEDPFAITNLKTAAGRLSSALRHGEAVGVIGDYDVDGVTSTVVLVSVIRRLGGDPAFMVPRRLEEGYGLSRAAIDRFLDEHPVKLLVAVDCGTNSVEEVGYLRERGVDVIIVDHHRSKERLPDDCILINPHVCDENPRPWTQLCTVGLAFKLVHGLLKLRRQENDKRASEIILKDYLDLVAMGTVADLVPLLEENRIFCKFGMRVLRQGRRQGISSLLEIAGVRRGDEVQPVDISFRIGPRINASGRLADATVPVELLLSRDRAFCDQTARQLDEFNRERQDIERQITLDAEKQRETLLPDASGIVLYDENWHSGVVGIVASRVCRRFHRPAIILGSEGKLAKGSGRSVEGLNLVSILETCDDLLTSWGGHPLAVGVSLEKHLVPAFQRRFDERVRELCGGREIVPELEIAHWIEVEELGEELLHDLYLLHPFGQGNREPILGLRNLVLTHPPEIFRERHFRFRIFTPGGRRVFGVAWKMADRPPPTGEPIDIVFRLNWNIFKGRKSMQLELVDWRPAGQPL